MATIPELVRALPAAMLAIWLAFGAAAPGVAQEPDDGGEQALDLPALTESARVSLISTLPGDDLYSLFGHSALRVRDPGLGLDRSYNFGTFEFGDSPVAMASFVARFTYGDLNYSLTVQEPGAAVVRAYWTQLGRASVEQVLDLTRSEAQELFRLLEINALPENRYYQYDFFFDNCATRLVDALEAVLGPRLRFDAVPPDRSFRQLLDPYLTSARWVDLGMDLGLGLPADREATAREATFVPEHLMDYIGTGRVERADGSRPLVVSTEALTGGADVSWQPGTDLPWPAIAGWALFALGTVVTWRDARAGRHSRPAADAAFFGSLGLAGLAVAFLWFVSLHDVTDRNLNLAWALPTHLVLAVLLARRRAGRRAGFYLAGTAILALIVLQGFPWWPQELPDALVPLLALIVVRATWLARVRLGRRAVTPSRPGSPPSPP